MGTAEAEVSDKEIEEFRERLRTDTPLWGREVGIILNKQRRLVPYECNPGQLAFDAKVEAQRLAGRPMRAVVLKARQIGFCLDPDTRVLTADLRWVRIDDLEVGQEIVATDESIPGGRGKGRKMRRGTVEAKWDRYAPGFRLTMADGRELLATGQHRFLCKRRGGTEAIWRTVETMQVGEQIRYVTEPWDEPLAEDGWMGGMIDGEGHFRAKSSGGAEVCLVQRLGPIYDRMISYLRDRGYHIREDLDVRTPEDSSVLGTVPVGRIIAARTNELFRLAGQTRPTKLLNDGWWEGKDLPGKRSGAAWSRVVAIEPLAPQRFVDIQTSTATFIAEGYVSHNSTHIQGKLIQRSTMTANYHTAVVAHDRETGGKLYRIGQRFYSKLPADIKPGIASYRQGQRLHFGDKGDSWMEGDIWPDSSYYVDTANETEAGRGGTYAAIHGSEVAFWADVESKLTGLQSAVPDDPETMLFLESTANGHNDFKDFWDDAVAGRNEYLAFFWAWHQEPSYTLPFSNEWEREAFVIGDGDAGPIAEDEEMLIDRFGLSLEQLNWRRWTIRNKTLGRVDKFEQEYPSFAEQAFLTTGRRVFDPQLVSGILLNCDITDPKAPTKATPGPERGALRAARTQMVGSQRGGQIERPEEPEWVPDPAGQWRLWHDREQMFFTPPEESRYVIGVDVSGGEMKETSEPAWNAISVIDHETREQVAEYRSREDDMLLAIEVYMAAKFFNDAWVAIEITGGWGLPVNRRLILDYGYPHCYHRTPLDNERGREQDLFGWDTNMRTKPIMVAGFVEMVREGTHGVKSRVLADEMLTYVREDTGKMKPESGKFSDLLMAEMIAQQVATLMPIRRPVVRTRRHRRVRDKVTGY